MKIFTSIILFVFSFNTITWSQPIYPKKEYAAALHILADALLKRQMKDSASPHLGGIWCAHCQVWHTRAAEAVFPFTVMYLITNDEKYLTAAKADVSWLIKQQQPNGSWKETPEEWTGTTTDQLLMLLLSYEKISDRLTAEEKNNWLFAMRKAADYLDSVMRPEFASINYVATTTATLAKAGTMFNHQPYLQKAKQLAHRTISKMDDDGFLNGEGGKSHGNKMGVDLGYDMEMSLWGLGLYASITNDTLVNTAVKKALKNHLYFIYPDGSMDGSWGIRSNKWTGYGSATSDGCQALFSLYADEDPRYVTAAIRNLHFLLQNLQDDLIGYGLQHGEVFATPPCIYPTFAKAKNIALAYELENKHTRFTGPLPSDSTHWLKCFPTLDVIEVRTQNFMATITGYRYKDQAAGSNGKYMYRPTGGALSHVWLNGHGFLQASSPTRYTRPEPMSFPEAPGVMCLTPRIEYTDSIGYFTNLYEYDSRLMVEQSEGKYFAVTVNGELKDKDWLTGGVGYRINYVFTDSSFQKSIRITYHDAWPVVKIIEPFINFKGMKFEKKDNRNVVIEAGKTKLLFSIISGNADIITGRNEDKYWTPYPALKAYPIELEIHPEANNFTSTVTYSITRLQ